MRKKLFISNKLKEPIEKTKQINFLSILNIWKSFFLLSKINFKGGVADVVFKLGGGGLSLIFEPSIWNFQGPPPLWHIFEIKFAEIIVWNKHNQVELCRNVNILPKSG